MTYVYRDYQFMYMILCTLKYIDRNEEIVPFLFDAAPVIGEEEGSAIPLIYEEFKRRYELWKDHKDFSYSFILHYLKYIELYDGLYDAITSITKETYLKCCKDILINQGNQLKDILLDR